MPGFSRVDDVVQETFLTVTAKADDLTILDPEDDLHGLRAIKKSKQVRGPREIEAWFDPESGTPHRLDLAGLPQQKGGPSAVRIELLGERDLGADFFSHSSHHGPDREVIEESPSLKE